uniref:Enoyl reductase (ER) domain-containing protein n=1 Tax=Pyramimonas obovata TaxID=1411642 RepID=A0A7S0R4K1_9CHLO|eukprot:CAMPEP_0118935136 /NCGR_PEP_ID=MMETSP1169-20130426/14967_1 /TAXON_ID=36882 /ORGANISM="Pyramimonas obovata, Strain CCMP722" /LENGTH=347 /DNA_ID=CAMNT_0006878123 /DNA_START=78 /DNA_END=1121 /DNA_ORIENTATION=-
MATYKAYGVPSAAAKAELMDIPCPELGAADVEIDVTHCGICHSDVSLADGEWGPFSVFPQICGHEAVGTVAKVGSAVTHLKPGMRVGVGWQRASCMSCQYCKIGEGECCIDKASGCVPTCAGGGKGGFAKKLFVMAEYAIEIPEKLASEDVGPLFCGGITVYKPLAKYAKPGMRVGVVGIGGLGHMAVLFAKAMGCSVTAYSTSKAKEELAKQLGADQYVVSTDEAAMAAGAEDPAIDVMIVTINQTSDPSKDWATYASHLKMKGAMVFVGAVLNPVPITMFGPPILKDLVFAGSHIGGPKEIKEMLQVAADKGVKPMVEVLPFDQINTALDKVRDNSCRFRMVLKW